LKENPPENAWKFDEKFFDFLKLFSGFSSSFPQAFHLSFELKPNSSLAKISFNFFQLLSNFPPNLHPPTEKRLQIARARQSRKGRNPKDPQKASSQQESR
jgi:hypothetical protein